MLHSHVGPRLRYAPLATLLACGEGPRHSSVNDRPLLPHVPVASALELAAISALPVPTWRPTGGTGEVILPGWATPAELRVEQANGTPLLTLRGHPRGSRTDAFAGAATADAIRVRVVAGDTALSLSPTELSFTDSAGGPYDVHLPELNLSSGQSQSFWVTRDGSTFAAGAGDLVPSFASLAQPRLAWRVRDDFTLRRLATGFEEPMQVVPAAAVPLAPTEPLLYVLERRGTIGVVLANGTVAAFAQDLLDFSPGASGEGGLGGIAVDPDTGDLYVSLLTTSETDDPSGPRSVAIDRLQSTDGGLTASVRTRVRSFFPELALDGTLVSSLAFGADGLLYVSLGTSGNASEGDLDRFHGKLLRMTRGGGPSPGNPYYNADDGITARDFVFASGLSAPHGLSASPFGDNIHFLESTTSSDHWLVSRRGQDYGLSPLGASALHSWSPAPGAHQLAFLSAGVLAGSGFPAEYTERAYASLAAGNGPGDSGHKAIAEWLLSASGLPVLGPSAVAVYRGEGAASPTGLAAGAFGLYFSDGRADDPSDADPQTASVFELAYRAPATAADCNQNGTSDATDLSSGTSLDCNDLGTPDECDVSSHLSRDCNHNSVPDECEVGDVTSLSLAAGALPWGLLGDANLRGALELTPAPGQTASAWLEPSDAFAYFRSRVEFQISGAGSRGLAFCLFDAEQLSPPIAFSASSAGNGALVVAVEASPPDGEPRGVVTVRYDGELWGRYRPSFPLTDARTHSLELTLNQGRLGVTLITPGGGRETAFAGLTLGPESLTFSGFGLEAENLANEVTHRITAVEYRQPGLADLNSNGRPDGCECTADVDDGLQTGESDGYVTDDDLRYYLEIYAAGQEAADLDDGSGTGQKDGRVSIADLRYYQQRWRAGC